MSRIGKNPVSIPQGVNVNIEIENDLIVLDRASESKNNKAQHGLMRALISNMIEGVSKGWTKELQLVGVGYRASNQGQKLDLALGFSHNIILELAPEVQVETISEKGKDPIIKLTSFDKQLVRSLQRFVLSEHLSLTKEKELSL